MSDDTLTIRGWTYDWIDFKKYPDGTIKVRIMAADHLTKLDFHLTEESVRELKGFLS